MTDNALNFQKEFAALIRKYGPHGTVNVCPWYGDVEGFEISVDDFKVVEWSGGWEIEGKRIEQDPKPEYKGPITQKYIRTKEQHGN